MKVEEQLDVLLAPYVRLWPEKNGLMWYHVAPNQVAECLVALKAIFPSEMDVARIVARYPRVMDAPDDLLREFVALCVSFPCLLLPPLPQYSSVDHLTAPQTGCCSFLSQIPSGLFSPSRACVSLCLWTPLAMFLCTICSE